MIKRVNRIQWKLTLSHFLVSSIVVGIMVYSIWLLLGEVLKVESLFQFETAVLRSIVYESDGTTHLNQLIDNAGIEVQCDEPLNFLGTKARIQEISTDFAGCEISNRIIIFPMSGYLQHRYRSFVSISVWDAEQNMVDSIPAPIDFESDQSAQLLWEWALKESINEEINENSFGAFYTLHAIGHTVFAPPLDEQVDGGFPRSILNDGENGIDSYIIPIRNSTKTEVIGAVLIQFGKSRMTLGDAIQLTVFIPIVVLVLFSAMMIGLIGAFLIARGFKQRIGVLQQATAEWAIGDFSSYIDDRSRDEIGQLSRDLNQMSDQLIELLDTRSMLAGAETRNQLARDLHDAAKQQLFAAGLQLDAVTGLLEAEPIKARSHLDNATNLTQQAQAELAAVINQLRPIQLQEKGFVDAAREAVERFAQHQGVRADFTAKGVTKLPAEVEVAFYRILQEGLSNVAKHSGATQVEVWLEGVNDELLLVISDNGDGFDPNQDSNGFGLHSMRQRIERLGGKMDIESSSKLGTTLQFKLDLSANALVEIKGTH